MNKPDYARLWHKAMSERTASGNQYKTDPDTARAYDRSAGIWSDGRERAAALPFGREDTVLDIGAGPGVLAVPLAHKVRAVTVVEPSETMLELLQNHCRTEHVQNIRSLCCDWESVDKAALPMHDYVIASYSLAMPDIRRALLEMDRAARKKVYLYWFCGLASWEKRLVDLYPAVHGHPFSAQPKSDLLYGVLCQMGLSPEVEHLTGTSFDRVFADLPSAIADLRLRLRQRTEQHDALLEDYIRKNYQTDGEHWIFHDETNYVRISWTPATAAKERALCRAI